MRKRRLSPVTAVQNVDRVHADVLRLAMEAPIIRFMRSLSGQEREEDAELSQGRSDALAVYLPDFPVATPLEGMIATHN